MQLRGDMVYLSLKVQPRASRNEVGDSVGNELKVKVTAPPVDSAANEALVRFLADKLKCPRHVVAIVRGASSRHKTVSISSLGAETVLSRLLG